MTDDNNPADNPDDDITEDTIDRPAAAPPDTSMIDRLKATGVQRAATRMERLKKRAECDADRTLAITLLAEAVHRAEAFAHEAIITERMLTKLKALADLPGNTTDYSESIALLEARKEVAEEALPALLDIRAHRKKLLDLTTLAVELEEPSTEELWTLGSASALAASPYVFAWWSAIAKAKVAGDTSGVAADPGSDPIPAAPTP